MSQKDIFLKTGLTQIETVKVISDKIKPTLEFITYNIKRYKIPVTLVLIYTQEDVSKFIKNTDRLTDVLVEIKIGRSYFNFVILPFTEEVQSYNFIKHVEKNKLNNISHAYYYEELKPQIHNYYNFINNYLFQIQEDISKNKIF